MQPCEPAGKHPPPRLETQEEEERLETPTTTVHATASTARPQAVGAITPQDKKKEKTRWE